MFVPPSFFARALPKQPALAVPVAGVAGVVLPGCECGSVPVAGALVRRGVTPAAALAFLLAAPAINPIVLTATAVAFPGQPRDGRRPGRGQPRSSPCVMGWLWQRARPARLDPACRTARDLDGLASGAAFWASRPPRRDARRRFPGRRRGGRRHPQRGGAAPAGCTRSPTTRCVVVLALALLAVLLSICSEADAFVAASLTQFSLTARLVFLVVGPMIDLKLFAMQAGIVRPPVRDALRPGHLRLADPGRRLVGVVLL